MAGRRNDRRSAAGRGVARPERPALRARCPSSGGSRSRHTLGLALLHWPPSAPVSLVRPSHAGLAFCSDSRGALLPGLQAVSALDSRVNSAGSRWPSFTPCVAVRHVPPQQGRDWEHCLKLRPDASGCACCTAAGRTLDPPSPTAQVSQRAIPLRPVCPHTVPGSPQPPTPHCPPNQISPPGPALPGTCHQTKVTSGNTWMQRAKRSERFAASGWMLTGWTMQWGGCRESAV